MKCTALLLDTNVQFFVDKAYNCFITGGRVGLINNYRIFKANAVGRFSFFVNIECLEPFFSQIHRQFMILYH